LPFAAQAPPAVARQNDLRRQRHEFHGIFLHEVLLKCRPAAIDPDVAAFDPASLLQRTQEDSIAVTPGRVLGRNRHEYADAPHPLGLLGARRKRPRRRAAEPRDELSPFDHSIT
jgi:hypothetical protein